MIKMLLDDAIAIECEYPPINQGETGKRWFRIKTALAKLGTTPNNAMVPCCVYRIPLDKPCNGCIGAFGSNRRVVAQHQ